MKIEMTVVFVMELPDSTPEEIWHSLILTNSLTTLEFGLLNKKGKVWEAKLLPHAYETTHIEKVT